MSDLKIRKDRDEEMKDEQIPPKQQKVRKPDYLTNLQEAHEDVDMQDEQFGSKSAPKSGMTIPDDSQP